MSTSHKHAGQRAMRARRRRRVHPMEAHVFTFAFFGPDDRRTGRLAAVVVRGKMGQIGAIPGAYDKASAIAAGPFCIDIRTYPSRLLPERTPHLDRICVEHTGFRSFLDLLIAVAGYRPSIRLDLMGRDGAVLAAAYDRMQARLGDARRALVIGAGARAARGSCLAGAGIRGARQKARSSKVSEHGARRKGADASDSRFAHQHGHDLEGDDETIRG